MDTDLKTGVVAVVRRDGRYLMIRRSASVIAPGAWCFVGGAIEPGESQEQAVVREFREEVGGTVRPLERIRQYTRPDGRLRLYWWRAQLLEQELHANSDEVAEIRWCRPAEIRRLPDLLESNREFLDAIGQGIESVGDERAAP